MAFLDDLKDRLGFGATDEEEEFDEELYGEGFDENAEEFDGSYPDEDYLESEAAYSAFTPVTTRSASRTRRDRGYSSRPGKDGPQLISIDDVRNSTRIPESLQRDPLPPRRGENNGRNSVGRASDFARSGSEVGAPAVSAAEVNLRNAEPSPAFEAGSSVASPAEVGMTAQTAAGYDPYRAYEVGDTSSHRPTRSISVIAPMSYNEVENVARMLRAGDAVVLTLRNTPSQLSKRILDFSFGVASALDAAVDCIADKVFAITRVSNLSEDELSRLRSQGVI